MHKLQFSVCLVVYVRTVKGLGVNKQSEFRFDLIKYIDLFTYKYYRNF